MMASPLAMTNDLRHLTQEDLDILLNKEIIAIDQDPLGKAAHRVVCEKDRQVFVRPLADGSHAVAILNPSDRTVKTSVAFASLGLQDRYTVRDVWKHADVSRSAVRWQGKVAPHETVVLVLKK